MNKVMITLSIIGATLTLAFASFGLFASKGEVNSMREDVKDIRKMQIKQIEIQAEMKYKLDKIYSIITND